MMTDGGYVEMMTAGVATSATVTAVPGLGLATGVVQGVVLGVMTTGGVLVMTTGGVLAVTTGRAHSAGTPPAGAQAGLTGMTMRASRSRGLTASPSPRSLSTSRQGSSTKLPGASCSP
jgi:hypothetical protein